MIPVLDVLDGVALQARSGERGRYRPVRSVLAGGADPVILGRAFRDELGLSLCYVADLGAIEGRSVDLELIAALAAEGLDLWIDAGIADVATASQVLSAGASRAVIGSETLPGLEALDALSAALPVDRLAFSLDLRGMRPVGGAPRVAEAGPLEIAGRSAAAGYRSLIVLDLDRVGARTGPAFQLLARLKRGQPDLDLIAAGGVRDRRDLERLADLGCAGALVATAIHTGRITRYDVDALRRLEE